MPEGFSISFTKYGDSLGGWVGRSVVTVFSWTLDPTDGERNKEKKKLFRKWKKKTLKSTAENSSLRAVLISQLKVLHEFLFGI